MRKAAGSGNVKKDVQREAWEACKKTEKGKGERKLTAFQYASEMECKNRNCKMCNCKLGWTNAGIASDVSRRLFRYYLLPLPSFSSWISSNSSKRLARPGSSLLFLLPSFNDRARGFHVDFTNEIFSFVHKWYDRCDCVAMQLSECHSQRKVNVFYLLPAPCSPRSLFFKQQTGSVPLRRCSELEREKFLRFPILVVS